MLELKRLIKHSAIYFTGNVLNRLGIFLLLPIYTNHLTPDEYGTLELVFVTVAFIRIMLGVRLGHAILRFYFEYKEEAERNKLVSTALASITFWCLVITGLLMLLASPISGFIYNSVNYASLLRLGFLVMFFEVISEIPYAYFRAKEYSVLYVVSSLAQLLIRVALNIYIVVYLHKGVEGILTGNLFGAVAIWLFLNFFVYKSTGFALELSRMKDIFKYSYPLILASIPGLVWRNIDRVFLGWYASLETVGLYALAIRFGMALRSFVLEPFQMNYGPFRFSIMKQENAKEVYARTFTYFLFAVMFIGLFISSLSREVIEMMASKAFRDAYKVVPILVLSVIANGINYNFQTGLLIEKKTGYMPYISISSALFNIAALAILVPLYGMYGAALAVFISSCLEMFLTLWLSQKCYPVGFEFQRVIKIIAATALIYLLTMLTAGAGLYARIVMKALIVMSYPLILMVLKFYEQDEIEKLFALKERVKIKALSSIGVIRR
ncbi:MAG: oligosaccharide flippase family protein [Nitrospirae bacterium]|nr:oligosaccharide flippase family protein [Nitrospirota bacterium]